MTYFTVGHVILVNCAIPIWLTSQLPHPSPIVSIMSANSAPPSTREVMEYALKKGVSEEALGSQCTEGHYLELANKMTGWNEVAPHMLDSSAVEEIRGDGCSERDKKLKMLRKWSQRFAFKATYRALIGVFVKAQRADLAQLVCDILGDSKGGTGCARENRTYHYSCMHNSSSVLCKMYIYLLCLQFVPPHQLDPVNDPAVPAQVSTSEHSGTEASRKAEFVLTTPPHSPTNEVKQMPPDYETSTTDSPDLLKGNIQPAADSSDVSSVEQRMTPASQSTMVISTPPTMYWPPEVKDKLTVVCNPNDGLPEHYRTELDGQRRRIEQLELEAEGKKAEHSAKIQYLKIKCDNVKKQKSLLERQLSESAQNEKRLARKLSESENNETILKQSNETLTKQLASANEKIVEYNRRIQQISDERDRALQHYDDLFRKENDLFLKTVSESLANVEDPRHEADLKWLQEKATITMDKSRSCPSFKTLTV